GRDHVTVRPDCGDVRWPDHGRAAALRDGRARAGAVDGRHHRPAGGGHTMILPKWADVVLIPVINLFLALLVSGLVVLLIGENPFNAMKIMVKGAVGSTYGWGYTLFYATNFIFTGLAVAIAFHA